MAKPEDQDLRGGRRLARYFKDSRIVVTEGSLGDLGVVVEVQLNTDSSAAKSIASSKRSRASSAQRGARVVDPGSCSEG